MTLMAKRIERKERKMMKNRKWRERKKETETDENVKMECKTENWLLHVFHFE